jgi:hypothetical protein
MPAKDNKTKPFQRGNKLALLESVGLSGVFEGPDTPNIDIGFSF